jgi:hypothetical protein
VKGSAGRGIKGTVENLFICAVSSSGTENSGREHREGELVFHTIVFF